MKFFIHITWMNRQTTRGPEWLCHQHLESEMFRIAAESRQSPNIRQVELAVDKPRILSLRARLNEQQQLYRRTSFTSKWWKIKNLTIQIFTK